MSTINELLERLHELEDENKNLKKRILVVDLYGDGEVLRIVEDTPENRKAILEWDEQGAPMDFSSFCERKGIKEVEFETLVLRNT